MSQFDPERFEKQIQELLTAYRQLQKDHAQLTSDFQAEQQRNQEARQRLATLLKRIRALETEASHSDQAEE